MSIVFCVHVVSTFSMRNRTSIRREQQESRNYTGDLVHNADNTTSMLAIQDLVKKAKHVPEEVQKSIIRAGLQRHLYLFEPCKKQIDAI